MELYEFRELIKNDFEETLNQINNYISVVESPTSKSFPNNNYNFSWSSLVREFNKYNYIYNKNIMKFVFNKFNDTEDKKELNKFTINKKYNNYSKTLNVKINDEIYNKLKIISDDFNMISQCYIVSKLLDEALEKYINNNK